MTRSLLAFVLLLSVGSCTLYSVLPNYTVIYERHPSELAHATYDNTVYEKGWNFLRIYASAQVGLLDQHRGAGFLEGYASYRDIYSAYRNLCGALLEGEQLPTLTQDFVDEQLEYIEDMIASHPRDIYWQYA